MAERKTGHLWINMACRTANIFISTVLIINPAGAPKLLLLVFFPAINVIHTTYTTRKERRKHFIFGAEHFIVLVGYTVKCEVVN